MRDTVSALGYINLQDLSGLNSYVFTSWALAVYGNIAIPRSTVEINIAIFIFDMFKFLISNF
ncbi:MAG: hypothetical protein COV29_03835 [Candidatus Yanofskybacteria bacterium CG10_big_fil_rev_8_21_14_0_10_36_16]|uniref:Uncharacterized protein n=1 Tax=Candidatus Yanofskybacteria bacterium CG10_big_fil_rev_8_21_14_0_10_36_16 TaxID=1975096 RepID=A0A2J0Q6M1_9BACT|nr:MAG: hypothetical protein COV29_03835 [Candidatus Yanofskybacteria bacterium CG10_big_fil_rev_8_21_14_0_10_36_16]